MFNPRNKSIITSFFNTLRIVTNNHSFSNNNPSLFFAVRSISKTSNFGTTRNLTISYLRNEIGFSEKSAVEASRGKAASDPDIFKILFKSKLIGADLEEKIVPWFNILSSLLESNSKVIAAIKKKPSLIWRKFNVERLSAKIEFFRSKGASGPDIFDILFQSAYVMNTSLEEHMIPCFNHLSNLFQSDSKTISFLMTEKSYILHNGFMFGEMLDNVKFLREDGVPESDILLMFNENPDVFISVSDQFKWCVKLLKRIGMDRSSEKFLPAISVFLNERYYDGIKIKFLIYKHYGFSKEDIWEVFRRDPDVLAGGEFPEQIAAVMDFLVEQIGFQPLVIVNQPSVFGLDFKKRIVPRGLYAKELMSKGLIKELSLSPLFDCSEKEFLQMFINRFEDEAPELLQLYKEKCRLGVKGIFVKVII
ncbi:hypothetical protein V6N13_050781 [Hibiscus sabdariffa]